MKRFDMQRVVNGKRYNTKSATLVADDVYWDGNNFERSGRNSWLYRTPRGAFFLVTASQWQGERDSLEPLTTSEAKEYYEEHLPEHYLDWEQVFGEEALEPEPDPKPGRPTLYDQAMKPTPIYLPEEMLTWLKDRPGGVSETIRDLIHQAMQP